jgi:DNA-binding protein HU-beta
VKAGELQADQAREAVSDLIERSRKSSEKLLETVRKEVRAQITERGLASKADLDKLEARISKLFGAAAKPAKAAASKVAPTAKKTAKKATAKKATAKKATAKKATAKKATAKKTAAKKAPATKRA